VGRNDERSKTKKSTLVQGTGTCCEASEDKRKRRKKKKEKKSGPEKEGHVTTPKKKICSGAVGCRIVGGGSIA